MNNVLRTEFFKDQLPENLQHALEAQGEWRCCECEALKHKLIAVAEPLSWFYFNDD